MVKKKKQQKQKTKENKNTQNKKTPHIHLSPESLWKPFIMHQDWKISGCYNIMSKHASHKGKQESPENKYQSLILYPFLMQTWTAAKEKGEASVGLLYLKVPHRVLMHADMRDKECCARDRPGRGYCPKEGNSCLAETKSHQKTTLPHTYRI